jgi:hypothetical protein
MLKAVLAMFMTGGIAAWGQAQADTSSRADKVDRATAYYHFMLAHMYAEMAATSGKNGEYATKASENYKAAIKADPKAPDPTKVLRPLVPYIPRLPGSHSGSISK